MLNIQRKYLYLILSFLLYSYFILVYYRIISKSEKINIHNGEIVRLQTNTLIWLC